MATVGVLTVMYVTWVDNDPGSASLVWRMLDIQKGTNFVVA